MILRYPIGLKLSFEVEVYNIFFGYMQSLLQMLLTPLKHDN